VCVRECPLQDFLLLLSPSVKAVRSRCETADDQLAEDFARG